MEEFVEQAVKVYRDCCKISSVTKAVLGVNKGLEGGANYNLNVISDWTQRDLTRNELRKFQKAHAIKFNNATSEFSVSTKAGFPNELNNEQLSTESPSGKLKAVVQKVSAKQNEEEKQIIEIWSSEGLVKSIDVNAAKKHGKIHDEGPFKFGCLQWSPSEKYLLYVAEKKVSETASYFDKNLKGDESSEKQKPIKGEKFVYREDWGEQLVGVCHPILAILDVENEEIKIVEGIPDNLSAGQALWCEAEKSILFVCVWHDPIRLGYMYCSQRRSGIFLKRLDDSEPEQISDTKFSVHSPRMSPQKDKLIYIAVDSGTAPHMNCGRLMLYDLKAKSTETIIDIVDVPEVGGFPGVFVRSLPKRCWSSDGNNVIFDSYWRSEKHILTVDLEEKKVKRLTHEMGNWTVLDVHNDFIVSSFSDPATPPRLLITNFHCQKKESSVIWTTLAVSCSEYDTKSGLVNWEIMSFVLPEESKEDLSKHYEAIFVTPKLVEPSKKPYLLVFPHGGPHSVHTAGFTLSSLALCRLGFAVLMINFRGSIGFGKSSLYSLPGKVGTQDIQEVQLAASTVFSSGRVDPLNVFVCGGSHGGFLTAHLLGQFPDFYRASAIRNGVFNIATMTGISDIPDWCYFECGLSYDYDTVPSPESLLSMFDKSPIQHSSKIKAPTLLLLGDSDVRVPASEGKTFYKILKSRGIKTKLLLYPDNHPLGKVEVESDAFINMVKWFIEHRKQPAEN